MLNLFRHIYILNSLRKNIAPLLTIPPRNSEPTTTIFSLYNIFLDYVQIFFLNILFTYLLNTYLFNSSKLPFRLKKI